MPSMKTQLRRTLKTGLARAGNGMEATGLTVLIYHRVGGGTPDERDVTTEEFREQMAFLADPENRLRVLSIDDALDELEAGDDRAKIVLTFDDGFADVHQRALPVLLEHGLPFTTYVATAYAGDVMQWEGSTATGAPGRGMDWDQLGDVVASGLATIGNHTHSHARPEALSADELDTCSRTLQERLGVTPRHFAYTWGVPVRRARPWLEARFRSAVTGELGRNHPRADPLHLRRVPVRGSDPLSFFARKVRGPLTPERGYDLIVRTAKRLGVPA